MFVRKDVWVRVSCLGLTAGVIVSAASLTSCAPRHTTYDNQAVDNVTHSIDTTTASLDRIREHVARGDSRHTLANLASLIDKYLVDTYALSPSDNERFTNLIHASLMTPAGVAAIDERMRDIRTHTQWLIRQRSDIDDYRSRLEQLLRFFDRLHDIYSELSTLSAQEDALLQEITRTREAMWHAADHDWSLSREWVLYTVGFKWFWGMFTQYAPCVGRQEHQLQEIRAQETRLRKRQTANAPTRARLLSNIKLVTTRIRQEIAELLRCPLSAPHLVRLYQLSSYAEEVNRRAMNTNLSEFIYWYQQNSLTRSIIRHKRYMDSRLLFDLGGLNIAPLDSVSSYSLLDVRSISARIGSLIGILDMTKLGAPSNLSSYIGDVIGGSKRTSWVQSMEEQYLETVRRISEFQTRELDKLVNMTENVKHMNRNLVEATTYIFKKRVQTLTEAWSLLKTYAQSEPEEEKKKKKATAGTTNAVDEYIKKQLKEAIKNFNTRMDTVSNQINKDNDPSVTAATIFPINSGITEDSLDKYLNVQSTNENPLSPEALASHFSRLADERGKAVLEAANRQSDAELADLGCVRKQFIESEWKRYVDMKEFSEYRVETPEKAKERATKIKAKIDEIIRDFADTDANSARSRSKRSAKQSPNASFRQFFQETYQKNKTILDKQNDAYTEFYKEQIYYEAETPQLESQLKEGEKEWAENIINRYNKQVREWKNQISDIVYDAKERLQKEADESKKQYIQQIDDMHSKAFTSLTKDTEEVTARFDAIKQESDKKFTKWRDEHEQEVKDFKAKIKDGLKWAFKQNAEYDKFDERGYTQITQELVSGAQTALKNRKDNADIYNSQKAQKAWDAVHTYGMISPDAYQGAYNPLETNGAPGVHKQADTGIDLSSSAAVEWIRRDTNINAQLQYPQPLFYAANLWDQLEWGDLLAIRSDIDQRRSSIDKEIAESDTQLNKLRQLRDYIVKITGEPGEIGELVAQQAMALRVRDQAELVDLHPSIQTQYLSNVRDIVERVRGLSYTAAELVAANERVSAANEVVNLKTQDLLLARCANWSIGRETLLYLFGFKWLWGMFTGYTPSYADKSEQFELRSAYKRLRDEEGATGWLGRDWERFNQELSALVEMLASLSKEAQDDTDIHSISAYASLLQSHIAEFRESLECARTSRALLLQYRDSTLTSFSDEMSIGSYFNVTEFLARAATYGLYNNNAWESRGVKDITEQAKVLNRYQASYVAQVNRLCAIICALRRQLSEAGGLSGLIEILAKSLATEEERQRLRAQLEV